MGETKEHCFQFGEESAITHRTRAVDKMLTALRKANRHPISLLGLENKIKETLFLPDEPTQILHEDGQEAAHRKNIIGWSRFLCGFISVKRG
jgi:hypothetical protein